ncbi:MAG: T9SS type A sorting domain-containing protein [Candidatus Kapaibacteriota bacterium]|jgi:hypothetical protein
MNWLKAFVIAILVCKSFVLAQQPLQINLSLIGNDTIVFDKLKFGFHPNATNGLDTGLGELDLPPLVPPSGYKLYGVFIFYDSIQKSNIWSYLDLKPFPTNSADTVKFLLYAMRESGIKLRIYWNTLTDEISSAWLVDEYLGTLVQVDMKKNNFANIENEFLDKFYIKIVLGRTNSVENTLPTEVEVNYSDISGALLIKNMTESGILCKIFDVIGNIVSEFVLETEKLIPANVLSKGIYFVELNYPDGKKIFKKVMVY